MKTCIICHKEFIPLHNAQKICNDEHYTKCAICDNLVHLTKYNTSKYLKGTKLTCCKECAIELMKETNLKKYGNICSAQNTKIRAKIEEHYQKTYGGNSPFCSKEIQQISLERRKNKTEQEKNEIKNKIKQTNLKNHGNENYNNPEKFKSTMQEKYGVNYTNESQELKLKQQKTMQKRYGVKCTFSRGSLRDKIDNILIKRYGTRCFITSDKTKQTNLERYGVPYYCMTYECRELAGNTISQINKKFKEQLDNLGIKNELEFNIEGYSFDLKIDNTLIEIDPTYTHNSTTGPIFKKLDNIIIKPKAKYYHKEKSQIANKNGYKCIHIFDWDDREKIINMLKDKQKIYARACELREVPKVDIDNFLDSYHLQNTCKGQIIRLGLYYKDELIQVMTFGKPRYNKNYEWELLRLCTKFEYKVIGGSEKLFKYFIDNFKPESIISYCDLSKFIGSVYEKLGFSLIKISNPSCHWSKNNLMITNNLLNQRGYDQLFGTNYGKGTSNKDLMIENGWKEVYDCGQASYVWKRSL